MATAKETAHRRALCSRRCTLNGRPAGISGFNRDFARIYDLESGLAAEWSWPAADLVMRGGGAFTS